MIKDTLAGLATLGWLSTLLIALVALSGCGTSRSYIAPDKGLDRIGKSYAMGKTYSYNPGRMGPNIKGPGPASEHGAMFGQRIR